MNKGNFSRFPYRLGDYFCRSLPQNERISGCAIAKECQYYLIDGRRSQPKRTKNRFWSIIATIGGICCEYCDAFFVRIASRMYMSRCCTNVTSSV